MIEFFVVFSSYFNDISDLVSVANQILTWKSKIFS